MITATTTQNAFQEMAFGAKAAAATRGRQAHRAPRRTGSTGRRRSSSSRPRCRPPKDGIATMTTTPDLFVRPFSQAVARGIPQVVGRRAAARTGSDVDTLRRQRQRRGRRGPRQGDARRRSPTNATGEIVIGNPIPGLPVLDQRMQGIKQVLQQKRPSVKLVGAAEHGPEPTKLQHLEGIVKAHPGRARLRRPGRPGRRLARADPAADRQEAARRRRATSTRSRCRRVKDGHVVRARRPRALAQGLPRDRAARRRPRRTARRCRGLVEPRRADS